MPLEVIQRPIGLLIGGFLPTGKRVNNELTPYMPDYCAHRLGWSIYASNTDSIRKIKKQLDYPPPINYLCPQNHSVMHTKKVETYQSPQIVTIETEYEGVVCSSNESLDENYGEW